MGNSSEVVGLPAGRVHLVEGIHTVDMVRAEKGYLLIHKGLLYFRKEWVGGVEEVGGLETAPRAQLLDVGLRVHLGEPFGHVPGKGGQHRRHIELALAGDDLLLQLLLPLQPRHRQRTAEAVQVCHTVPRQVRRTGEITANLLVGHPELPPHLVPDGLLSRDGERHIDTVQRHPVDKPLPLRPLPPRHRVAVGAVVMNRVKSGAYPNTIYSVIYASGQFTPAINGTVAKVYNSGNIYDMNYQAAEAAINGETTVGTALHFRRINGHEGIIIGAHVFW